MDKGIEIYVNGHLQIWLSGGTKYEIRTALRQLGQQLVRITKNGKFHYTGLATNY